MPSAALFWLRLLSKLLWFKPATENPVTDWPPSSSFLSSGSETSVFRPSLLFWESLEKLKKKNVEQIVPSNECACLRKSEVLPEQWWLLGRPSYHVLHDYFCSFVWRHWSNSSFLHLSSWNSHFQPVTMLLDTPLCLIGYGWTVCFFQALAEIGWFHQYQG